MPRTMCSRRATCRSSALWIQLKIAAPRGDPFCAQDDGALAQPIFRRRVETVHGVGHVRNPAEPRGDAAHHPRLRIVGVHEVEALPPEDREQLAEREDVFARVPGPRRVMPRDVTDPFGLDVGDPRTGRADRRDVEPGVAQRDAAAATTGSEA